MKQLFLLLTFAFLLFTSPVWAVIALSGSPAYDGTGGVAATIGTGNVNSLHDTAIMIVHIQTTVANDATVTGIEDTAGSTWELITAVASGDKTRLELWKCADLLGANASITVTLSDSRVASAVTTFYSGVQDFGNTNSATGSGVDTTVDVATQDNNNWAVAGVGSNGGDPYTEVTGTIEAQVATSDGSVTSASAIIDSSSASPATLTSAATLSSVVDWAVVAVELRSTTGAPPTFVARRKPIIIQ